MANYVESIKVGSGETWPIRDAEAHSALSNLETVVDAAQVAADNAQSTANGTKTDFEAAETALKSVTLTLAAADWTGDTAPYSLTADVAGMSSAWVPGIPVIVASGAMATNQAMREALACVNQITSAADALTFICYEDKPTADVEIKIPGVLE